MQALPEAAGMSDRVASVSAAIDWERREGVVSYDVDRCFRRHEFPQINDWNPAEALRPIMRDIGTVEARCGWSSSMARAALSGGYPLIGSSAAWNCSRAKSPFDLAE